MSLARNPLIIIILLSACSSSSTPSSNNSTATHQISTPIQGEIRRTPPTPIRLPIILRDETVTTPVEDNLKRLINAAKNDLAQRMDIPSDEINVIRIENAEWPDTSLGCAKPGLTLRFVAVPGYRIILSANGRNYVYHTNRENGIAYCPKDKGR